MIVNKTSELMGARRLKIADLVRGAEISRTAANSLYHATGTQLDLTVLDRVCRFLQVQPGDLFKYVPEEEQR